MMTNIVAATISEVRKQPDRGHVLERLRDWQARVHALYDSVQESLGNEYKYDRTGKHVSRETSVQRAGIDASEVPPIDILLIDRDGRRAATFMPRDLWVIGANGRIDLIIGTKSGGRRFFILYDQSMPLSGGSDWRIRRPTEGLQESPFRPERFHELLG
jgi:hypothetical protein